MTTSIPCGHCDGHGALPTYTRTTPSWFSDALGPTTDAPCEACGGTGFEPCSICKDTPATSTVASRPVCDDCAPFVRRAVAETIPAPAAQVMP